MNFYILETVATFWVVTNQKVELHKLLPIFVIFQALKHFDCKKTPKFYNHSTTILETATITDFRLFLCTFLCTEESILKVKLLCISKARLDMECSSPALSKLAPRKSFKQQEQNPNIVAYALCLCRVPTHPGKTWRTWKMKINFQACKSPGKKEKIMKMPWKNPGNSLKIHTKIEN